ncbi:DUF4365 domain-containing protein [Dolichospermum flos-aquae]|uniref:DUF4365 domain-containing protein n=1 Tax=Dolichospermum flos-aquae CCAP 1403/13F TaxID=315271 RepID=A0A6H2C4U6_DOLFA|nr:DUF4365 domain-containing protein [Dolichospermum flos-aquae]QJB46320.1 DUF4365 domain-containing protein [Dolichospermum flos-aquae CCAP 1403/13F]
MTLAMDRNTQKEEFSYAYIRAVSSVAGLSVTKPERPMDNAGVDITITVPGELGEVLFPKFDAQVKCTSSEAIIEEDFIKFPLPVKNYNRLRHENPISPQILIVVLVPNDITGWLNISENETLLKKCGYWLSLKGKSKTSNTTTITVDIPRKNILTPSSITSIMEKIAKKEDL